MMIYSKKSMWPWLDLNDVTQGQISATLLYPPIQTTFVWNIFSENAPLEKYFGAIFKMGHPVYVIFNMEKVPEKIGYYVI